MINFQFAAIVDAIEVGSEIVEAKATHRGTGHLVIEVRCDELRRFARRGHALERDIVPVPDEPVIGSHPSRVGVLIEGPIL